MKGNHTPDREPWLGAVIEAFDKQAIPPAPQAAPLVELLRQTDSAESSRISVRSTPISMERFKTMFMTRRAALVAAGIVMMLIVGRMLMPGALDSPQAIAQMLSNVRKTETAIMMLKMGLEGSQATSCKVYMKNPNWMRCEFAENGAASIVDLGSGKSLILDPRAKTATPGDQTAIARIGGTPLNLVEAFGNTSAALPLAKQVTEDGKRLLMWEMTNGQEPGPVLETRVWVDKQTLLPVRMTLTSTMPGADARNPVKFHIEYSQMQWNVPLDAELFSLEVPAGYTLQQAVKLDEESLKNLPKLDDNDPQPQEVVSMLKAWTTMSDGTFPDELDSNAYIEVLRNFMNSRIEKHMREGGAGAFNLNEPLWAPAGVPEGTAQERDAKYQELQMRYSEIMIKFDKKFGARLQWHWLGKGARVGDDRLICYWWDAKLKTYHAIDGKLNAQTLTAAPNQTP